MGVAPQLTTAMWGKLRSGWHVACAMPAAVGDGYPLIQDEWSGEKYGGMMEGMKAADEGRRTINVFDDNWKSQRMTHRVVEKMRHPLVSAGETIDNHNLVFMSRGTSFIVPESSEYGWALNQAVWDLAARYGTQDCNEMYRDRTNVFVFDAWVKPPPGGFHSVSKVPKDRCPGTGEGQPSADATGTRPGSEERTSNATNSGRDVAASTSTKVEKTVGLMDHVEIEEYEVEVDDYAGKWKKVQKGQRQTRVQRLL